MGNGSRLPGSQGTETFSSRLRGSRPTSKATMPPQGAGVYAHFVLLCVVMSL